MKKRILALTLCLVLATSLLPITAAAEIITSVELSATGIDFDTMTVEGKNAIIKSVAPDNSSSYGTELYNDGDSLCLKCFFPGHWEWVRYNDFTNAQCSLTIPNYAASLKSKGLSDYDQDGLDDFVMTFVLTPVHEHDWRYQISDARDSLKAKCDTSGCDIREVSVTITARSVTLPAPPFNAELRFEGDFKEVFHCSEINYQYEDPTTGWIDIDDPDAFTPKPGKYQAGVLISGLPTNGGAASRAARADNSTNQSGTAYLYVKYTASDPAVTAQTGDNRPIEVMMGSVLVFSALAAAAFILDSKRRLQQ